MGILDLLADDWILEVDDFTFSDRPEDSVVSEKRTVSAEVMCPKAEDKREGNAVYCNVIGGMCPNILKRGDRYTLLGDIAACPYFALGSLFKIRRA
jgi:hypothetical protein